MSYQHNAFNPETSRLAVEVIDFTPFQRQTLNIEAIVRDLRLQDHARDCARALEYRPSANIAVEGEADILTNEIEVERLTFTQHGEDIIAAHIAAAVRQALLACGERP
jgi:hypothetical protein